MDLFDIRGGTWSVESAVFVAPSGADKVIDYTSNPKFVLNGRHYTGDTCASGALNTTDITTGEAFLPIVNGQVCLFVLSWEADGTWEVSQGPIVNYDDLVNGAAVLDFPSIPSTVCPFAYISMRNEHATTTFTFATDNWNAATMTIGTAVNCALLPTQPLTAETT